MLCLSISLQRFSNAHLDLLEQTSVHPVTVFQVKGEARGFSMWRYFRFERDRFGWICINHGHRSQRCAVLIVEARDQASGEEHSKGTRKSDLAVPEASRLKRAQKNARVCDAVKFVSGPRG